MTKFMQKSFTVYNNYNSTPKCVCGERISIGYATVEGYLCPQCYKNRQQKKEEARIKALFEENS